MSKKRIMVFVMTCAALCGLVVLYVGHSRLDIPVLKETREPSDEFVSLLRDLDVPWTREGINGSNREQFLEHLQRRDAAARKLRELGTNALPRLRAEFFRVCNVDPQDPATGVAVRRLAEAFRVPGCDARVLLPDVIAALHGGRNVIPCFVALAGIGGTEAGLAYLTGLPNADCNNRFVAVHLFGYSDFRTNAEVAHAAWPLLVQCLRDTNAAIRATVALQISAMGVKADVVVPPLMELAERDEDMVVRAAALKAIGRLGTNAMFARSFLEKIALQDPEENVRRVALEAIDAVKGGVPR